MATTTSSDREFELEKEIKRQEVSLDELSSLSSSRSIYQKNGNLFFLTSAEKAKISAQKQLDYAKSEINKIHLSTLLSSIKIQYQNQNQKRDNHLPQDLELSHHPPREELPVPREILSSTSKAEFSASIPELVECFFFLLKA
ncbi:unnamed protein product [Arabidopsis thaliana]|uniref:Prefoldin chaperone subunit family protein n=1 Tax=Arabidopsis thaliana TaxID=3702 RepID=A0A5S9WNC9_ARATH|nr:unnamed protein product [Arabidopsis thaliana]